LKIAPSLGICCRGFFLVTSVGGFVIIWWRVIVGERQEVILAPFLRYFKMVYDGLTGAVELMMP
jgi:hypothetical protein